MGSLGLKDFTSVRLRNAVLFKPLVSTQDLVAEASIRNRSEWVSWWNVFQKVPFREHDSQSRPLHLGPRLAMEMSPARAVG